MLKYHRITPIAATFAIGLLSAAPVFAQSSDSTGSSSSSVVATVGSEDITEADIAAAEGEIGSDFQRLPPEQRELAVLAALIDIKVLAQEAEKASLQDGAETKATLDFLRDRTLHNAYFAQEGVAKVTDEDVRARYEKEIANIEPREEVQASHILLKSEADAKAVIEELDGGADFAELAKEKSTGPSAPNGGDLGFFSAGQMVPPFEEAAFALEAGSYTKEPVQTQFGWHVIRVAEKRSAEPPAFEQVEAEVRRAVLQERYVELVGQAREELGVEYVDPAIAEKIEQLKEQGAAAAAGTSSGTGSAN